MLAAGATRKKAEKKKKKKEKKEIQSGEGSCCTRLSNFPRWSQTVRYCQTFSHVLV